MFHPPGARHAAPPVRPAADAAAAATAVAVAAAAAPRGIIIIIIIIFNSATPAAAVAAASRSRMCSDTLFCAHGHRRRRSAAHFSLAREPFGFIRAQLSHARAARYAAVCLRSSGVYTRFVVVSNCFSLSLSLSNYLSLSISWYFPDCPLRYRPIASPYPVPTAPDVYLYDVSAAEPWLYATVLLT